ncbi:MAG: DUF3800 domain-containing protein [Bifidobacteriaceae bacterium]|nr:DUF3800 domain-containing protein [Bifidobacteriaceae bacterium]
MGQIVPPGRCGWGSRPIGEMGGQTCVGRGSLADSANSDLIQLADIVARSIYRSHLTHKTDHADYVALLKPKIDEVWDFE